MSEIEDKLYLARISHLSGLPEETLKYIEELILLKNGNINEEEKNLFFNSLKTLINFRRESWRTINALESKEKKNKSNLLPRVTELKNTLSESITEEMKLKILGDKENNIIPKIRPKYEERDYNCMQCCMAQCGDDDDECCDACDDDEDDCDDECGGGYGGRYNRDNSDDDRDYCMKEKCCENESIKEIVKTLKKK